MQTRRGFMGAAAALVMAPLIKLRPEIERESILREFCADVSSRYNLTSPFGIGSATYATDATRAVRVELVSRNEDGSGRRPDMERCFSQIWHPGEWRDFVLPSPEFLTLNCGLETCPHCLNRRVDANVFPDEVKLTPDGMLDCPRIEGLDWCPDDDTIRDSSCPVCHGRRYLGPDSVLIDGHPFAYEKLAPLAKIRRVRVSMSQSFERCLLFAGDGFDGCVLGLTDDVAE